MTRRSSSAGREVTRVSGRPYGELPRRTPSCTALGAGARSTIGVAWKGEDRAGTRSSKDRRLQRRTRTLQRSLAGRRTDSHFAALASVLRWLLSAIASAAHTRRWRWPSTTSETSLSFLRSRVRVISEVGESARRCGALLPPLCCEVTLRASDSGVPLGDPLPQLTTRNAPCQLFHSAVQTIVKTHV